MGNLNSWGGPLWQGMQFLDSGFTSIHLPTLLPFKNIQAYSATDEILGSATFYDQVF
jgi:hypothetical protein